MLLKPRLQVIYDLIADQTNHVVDVGADHAYLSIALIKNNKAKMVSNIEINTLPYKNGINNVKRHHYESKIHFYLNDGLKDLKLPHVDYICISGMGADNIIEIISNNNLNKPDYYLLQPNTDIHKLREYLFINHYEIINEVVIEEKKYYYEIIMVKPDHKINFTYSNEDRYIGPILKTCPTKTLQNYLLHKYNYLSKIIDKATNLDIINEYQTIKEFLNAKKWIS